MCLWLVNDIPFHVCNDARLSSLPLLSSLSALAELQQANLITGEECKGLSDIIGVVTVQSGKSPGVVLQTATVLRRYGFKEASKLLTGRHSQQSSVCLCYFALLHPFIA